MSIAIEMKGKAALVTGAASGLGRATAIKLAHAGADVCIVDLNVEGLDETATQLRALDVRVRAPAPDLSQPYSCPASGPAAVHQFARPDSPFNIAHRKSAK